MSKRDQNVYTTLNYTEHFLILASANSGCVAISAFASLVDIPIVIMSSAIGLKICAITAGIKTYKSIIKKKKKQHDKTVLLAKSKLNSIEVLIYNTLIDSVSSHDEFVLIINMLKEYNKMKKKSKILTINIYVSCNDRNINIRKRVY